MKIPSCFASLIAVLCIHGYAFQADCTKSRLDRGRARRALPSDGSISMPRGNNGHAYRKAFLSLRLKGLCGISENDRDTTPDRSLVRKGAESLHSLRTATAPV